MCCVPPVKPGNTFLYWLKYGTLQYTIISPIISIIAMVLNFFSLYGDGVFAYNRGYVYISFVQNCTQLISLYCLVWLYVAMKNELAPFSPMAKFLVVKSVVFFTFWQSVGLAVLVKASILTDTAEFDVGTLQVGLQDFIVCIEMFIAAAVHVRHTHHTQPRTAPQRSSWHVADGPLSLRSCMCVSSLCPLCRSPPSAHSHGSHMRLLSVSLTPSSPFCLAGWGWCAPLASS